MKRLIFISLAIFTLNFINISNSYATHVAGAEINYQCVGQDSFLVSLSGYRDCGGNLMSSTQAVNFYSPCGSFIDTLILDSIVEVSQICGASTLSSNCNGGTLPGGMHLYSYSKIVNIPPCSQGSYTINWTTCLRFPANNIGSSSCLTINAELDNYQASCNNSPLFNNKTAPLLCLNQETTYGFDVTEIDGDSLDFYLGTPYGSFSQGAYTNSTFYSPYSVNNPLNVPININPFTGDLTFTPNTQGVWVIKVCVDEYRSGIKIGTVCRDIWFQAVVCNNNPPKLFNSGITNFQGAGNQLNNNTIELCPGASISFDVTFIDSLYTQSNPAQTFGDSITLFSNITSLLPGATTSMINGDTATVHVNWTAPTNGLLNQYLVNVIAIDNACEIYSETSFGILIKINQPTNAGNDQSICGTSDTAFFQVDGGNLFEWSVIPNPNGSMGDPMITSGASQNFIDTNGISGKNVWMLPQQTTSYQVISDLGSQCHNIDTVTVWVVRDFNLNTFGDTAVCASDSVFNFQLDAVVDTSANAAGTPFNFSYQWSNDTLLGSGNVGNPTATVYNSSTFAVTVSSDSGCVKIDTVNIDIAPSLPDSIWVQYSDTNLCQGDSSYAQVNLPVGYSTTDFIYQWNPTTFITSPNGNQTSIYPPSTATYSLVFSDTLGACIDTLNQTLHVLNAFDASFNYPDSICESNQQNLIPNQVGGVFSGMGITDSTAGTFDASTLNQGLYTVYYEITSPSGNCDATDSATILVVSDPELMILDSVFCRTSGTQQLQTNFNSGFWNATFPIDSISGTFNPNPIGNNSLAYYHFQSSYCQFVDTFTIQLYSPHPFMANNSNLCINDTLSLNSLIQYNLNSNWPYTPLFSWSGSNLNNDTLYGTSFSTGNYVYHVTSHDSNGVCSQADSIVVSVVDTTALDALSSLNYCETDQQVYDMQNAFTATLDMLNINPINGTTSNLNNPFTPSTSAVGSWELRGQHQNNAGCISRIIDTIIISPIPDASFTYSDTGLTVGFSSNAVSGDQANWIFGDGGLSTQFNPVHTYSSAGQYIVELSVSNTCGVDVSTDTINIFNVGIDDIETEKWIQIYPNPSRDFIQFKNTSASLIEGELIIYNINGSIVHQKSVGLSPYSEMRIDHKLANGTYWLNIQTEDGRSITAKLIVSQ